MTLHELKTVQRLPTSLENAWRFFSDPSNLVRITPPSLGFRVTTALPPDVYAGLLIAYRVSPLGFPITWVTEITHAEAPRFFVDEQRFGLYRFWHHKHFFREIPGGVEMEDVVHYVLPGGALGNFFGARLVRRQLEGIFDFRRKTLEEIFGRAA